MNIDSSLDSNAIVYSLNYPDSLSDKLSGNRVNVNFGPYRVTDADISLTQINTRAENPDPIFSAKKVRKSGNTTTTTKVGVGPSSILGFSRPPVEGEPVINTSHRTINYKFSGDKGITWNALCDYKSKERFTQHENSNTTEMLSANFTCEYKEDGKPKNNGVKQEIWVLSVDYNDAITMTQKGKTNTLSAHPAGGIYVKPNGQRTNLTTSAAGYTWAQIRNGNDENVAAISVREEPPRVWLKKGNSDYLNNILAIANTGLLIYRWEIQH